MGSSSSTAAAANAAVAAAVVVAVVAADAAVAAAVVIAAAAAIVAAATSYGVPTTGTSSSTAAATSYDVPTTGPSSSKAATSYGVPTIGSSPPLPSPSFSSLSCAYEVFLSFRGEDVRKTFIDHLYEALDLRGIYTFKDDKRLRGDENISDQLLKAIEQSRSAVVVFSKGYASSGWCLEELEKIMDCSVKLGLVVYPVFYDVPPSDVRRQRETFGKGFAKAIERRPDKEDVWRKALYDAANFSGYDVQNTADGHEAQCIKKIVEWFWEKYSKIFASFGENLIGIKPRVRKLASLLGGDSNDDDVRMVGIWGMGGAGKSTLANVTFHNVKRHFDGASFIGHVREKSKRTDGLQLLQTEILSKILMDKKLEVNSVLEGMEMIKQRLGRKKVLIVLDDVDNDEQLKALAGNRNWFGKGSRILVTTREYKLLTAHGIDKCEMDLLHEDEAIQLFSKHAFEKCSPTQEYDEVSLKLVRYAARLPLTLEVLGSFLRGRDMTEWKGTLKRLKKFPEEKTFEILKISFDDLKYDEKDLFLDIACFFRGHSRKEVSEILESQGYHTDIGISILQQKCLITFSDDDFFEMHDLIEEMGRKIVKDSDPKEPGKRSRLWHDDEIIDVLENNKGTTAVEAILMSPIRRDIIGNKRPLIVDSKAFMSLKKLRLLHLDYVHGPLFVEPPYLSNELQWLHWSGYPYESLAESFQATKLVVLHMQDSHIVQLWKGKKLLDKLTVLNLSWSLELIRTPDFSGIPNLRELNLSFCISLIEVHPSIEHLQRLVKLELESCEGLVDFPSSIQMECLETLNFKFCSYFNRFPELRGNNDKISMLPLQGTAIEGLPSSIANLTNLVSIHLNSCRHLLALPDTICALKNIKMMDLSWCYNLRELPENLGHIESLEKLNLEYSGVEELPSSIVHLKNLKKIDLGWCAKLGKLPENMGHIESLEELILNGTGIEELPSSIVHLKNLKKMMLCGCTKLSKLPENLCHIESLEELYIRSGVEELPSSIGHLKNLKKMKLGGCTKLRKLPENLGHIESLEELDISDSGVEALPSSIGHLKNLKKLNLGWKLPENLGHIESLEELYISIRRVEELPSSIRRLKNLKVFRDGSICNI